MGKLDDRAVSRSKSFRYWCSSSLGSDQSMFDAWCIDCHPRGAAGLYSGNTWPSLAMVVVPEKFFLISPSHSESGRSGGA
jgi:hypothetical protein